MAGTDAERLKAVQDRIRLLEVQERIQTLEAAPSPTLPRQGQAPLSVGTPAQAISGDQMPRGPIAVTPPGVERQGVADIFPTPQEPPQVAAAAPGDIRDMLPGFEFRHALPALPKPAQIPSPELAPPLMAEGAGLLSTRGVPTALIEAGATTLTPGGWKPLAGAVASGVGELLEQQLHGEPMNLKKAGVEAGISALPELAESTGRAIGRTLLRNTPGGTRIRFDEAARQARAMIPEVFRPQSRQQIGEAFDRVRQSHIAINTDGAEHEVKRLTRGKYEELVSEAALLDSRYKTGGRYRDLVERLRTKAPDLRAGYDIGDLQQLSSGLRLRAEELGTTEARMLVRDFRNAIDDSIDAGMTIGPRQAGTAPQDLMQARSEWARMRAADAMREMVEKTISSTPDLAMNSFNMRRFYDDLQRNTSTISQDVNRALDRTPGARERFNTAMDTISQQFKTIELPLTDVSGWRRSAIIAGLGQTISSILVTEIGQRLFREAIIQGRGQLSPNMLALIANAARRETFPGVTQREGPPAPTAPQPGAP